jgi:hypothetical protein
MTEPSLDPELAEGVVVCNGVVVDDRVRGRDGTVKGYEKNTGWQTPPVESE